MTYVGKGRGRASVRFEISLSYTEELKMMKTRASYYYYRHYCLLIIVIIVSSSHSCFCCNYYSYRCFTGEQRALSLSVSEELKMRETQLDELRKQLAQWEGKLRQQQQLYEAVRSDRNHYSKGTGLLLCHCYGIFSS